MSLKTLAFVLPLGLLVPACSGDDGGSDGDETSGGTGDTGDTGDTGATCFDLQHAIVSDIDETLTVSDAEFLMQLNDSTYDPLEREEGAELITDYHDRGFTIVYLTARAEPQNSADNETPARQLTEEWLVAHGFPFDENTRVVMADNFVFGDTAAEYKGQALMDIQAEGFTFDYAYGNATSDIAGYDMAGIPKDVTFIIGEEAGVEGTQAIEGEGWAEHRAAHMPSVPNYCP